MRLALLLCLLLVVAAAVAVDADVHPVQQGRDAPARWRRDMVFSPLFSTRVREEKRRKGDGRKGIPRRGIGLTPLTQ